MSKAHSIALGGLTLLPHMSGAAYVPDERVLLVADLHLEQGAAMARRSVHLPPFDTLDTLTSLEAVLAETKPWRLILLGDSFHDAVAHEHLDEVHVKRLLQITSRIETIWISGNHDPEAPRSAGGFFAREVQLGNVTLRHIPTRRKNEFEIAGHLHPGAAVEQRGIRVRSKCFVADEHRLILPAFGRYTGSVNVRSEGFHGLLDPKSTQAWIIGREQMYKFPYSRLS